MAQFSGCVFAAFVVIAAGEAGVWTLRGQTPVRSTATPLRQDVRGPINVTPRPVRADTSVKLDYDIVYVRAPRKGDSEPTRWSEIAHPAGVEPGADLMLLHADRSEDLLVPGGECSVTDPYVSFTGEWVLYALVCDTRDRGRRVPYRLTADIYKIHVKTRHIVRLTKQPSEGETSPVLNLGPCPLPGGRVAFVSSRNGFTFRRTTTPVLQLFVMDDDGMNVEPIGALNLGGALHPAVLADGRIMFSSLEGQGLRNGIMWGLSSINPDGTHWAPLISAFDTGHAFHFQTQISDGRVIAEEYYNANNFGFGAYFTMPLAAPGAYPLFGPAYQLDPRNPPLRFGRYDTGEPTLFRLPFSPAGIASLTRFASNHEGEADPSVLSDPRAPRVGKFTHPSGAPDNHLLTVWSPGPVNQQRGLKTPAVDAGLYLIKGGQPIDEPGQMLLIKNDPKYNEEWPRALVPYRRIYGIDEPHALPHVPNDGLHAPALPEGTPFGLVGASSLYKRESYPDGVVPPGLVTGSFAGGPDRTGYAGLDPFNTSENFASSNWTAQGADAGRYSDADIHAIRIVALEPTKARDGRPLFRSHADERMRILGEIPVRKFASATEPTDPDGNPDTSFLAKIPADVAFTFQTLDANGMVLNMSQTWHQVRPGEVRTDCGGCHGHSQAPTPFALTRAGRPDYAPFDLTERAALLTTRAKDESRQQWDRKNQTGLRYARGVQTVEYWRDIRPILQRSCSPCHSAHAPKPAANLVLDDDTLIQGVPGTYYRLAMDGRARFGYKPIIQNGAWRGTNASRYIRKFQSRRSLLVWKIVGRRTDGWTNDDFPTETVPGEPSTLQWHGAHIPATRENRNRADLDYSGTIMPPPAAVAGDYVDSDGERVRVAPLTDEDRLTFVRWIDLGCPLDLAQSVAQPQGVRSGWMGDDQPPTLTVTYPRPNADAPISRILVGMTDYESGLDMSSFTVTADFPVDGVPGGTNLATRFRATSPGVWELPIVRPASGRPAGQLVISVKDRNGNLTQVVRSFSRTTSRP